MNPNNAMNSYTKKNNCCVEVVTRKTYEEVVCSKMKLS